MKPSEYFRSMCESVEGPEWNPKLEAAILKLLEAVEGAELVWYRLGHKRIVLGDDIQGIAKAALALKEACRE